LGSNIPHEPQRENNSLPLRHFEIFERHRHGGQQLHLLFVFSAEGRFDDFLEQDVCFNLLRLETPGT
jgi:hypothetical protein